MQKNFVLDTNVLLDNPSCIRTLRNGQENRVILPYTVLRELDKLKREPRVSHIVAQAIAVLQETPTSSSCRRGPLTTPKARPATT